MSCEEIIEVEDISQAQIDILAPTNDAVLNTTQLRFSWQDLEFSEYYRLQVATPNFLEAIQIVEDTLISTTEFNKILQVGDYQWRIKAINSAYQTQYQTQSFSIEE
ncbi:hypothetical protein BTO05_00595 [Winogradskyella sp. PC-19]|nr:hypothetical protein BTO05_00595 [Winogradskyella sp. PC-19]